LQASLNANRFEMLGGFESVRRCADGGGEVAMAGQDGSSWFFRVAGSPAGPWRMEKVGRRASRDCAGRDTLRR
jgi:hypothetical protein